jgi:pimeloyl-ACP methyl ester carboxylesterase
MRTVEPPLGRLHEIAGRRLMLHRTGEGGPSVVFLPGAGLLGLDFLNIQSAIAAHTTSVLYDRAGTGWSDPADLPRTPTEVTDELRALLRAAGVPAPYLLVGHSLGAFYARRHAQRFPDEVAALLLLDPGHEDILSFLPAEAAAMNEQMKQHQDDLPDLTPEQIAAARLQYAELYAVWPPDVRDPLIDLHLATWRTQLAETANFETEVYDELRAGGPLPDVPLIVLTAGGRNAHWAKFAPPEVLEKAEAGIHAMHETMAHSVPRGQHRTIPGATHAYLHIEHPGPVLTAIRDLLTA